jgi:hypothetical protein
MHLCEAAAEAAALAVAVSEAAAVEAAAAVAQEAFNVLFLVKMRLVQLSKKNMPIIIRHLKRRSANAAPPFLCIIIIFVFM